MAKPPPKPKAKSVPSPGKKARKARQRKVQRYMKNREDLQLAGVIAVTPEGAVRDETVNPASQGEQALPALDRDAVRRGWAVPEATKAKVIERLSEPFFEPGQTIIDKEGNQFTLPPDRRLLVENAKVLVLADSKQFERDRPDEAGKARGGTTVNVAVAQNVQQITDPFALYKQALAAVNAPDEIEAAIEAAALPALEGKADDGTLPAAAEKTVGGTGAGGSGGDEGRASDNEGRLPAVP